MNRRICSLICLLFLGCVSRPAPPNSNFGGIMTIRVITPTDFRFKHINSIFQVNGNKNEFYMYFLDEYNLPRGKVVVKNGKLIEEDIPFKNNIKKMCKYWPYLFGGGKSTRGIKFEYLNWKEVSGSKLPDELKITIQEISLNIKINYGN